MHEHVIRLGLLMAVCSLVGWAAVGPRRKAKAGNKNGVLVVALLALVSLLPTTAFAQGSGGVAGLSIACSNDHVYTWYADRNRRVTVGTSENLAAHPPARSYSLPPGKTPDDIIGIGIAGNDHVYAWYSDGTASSGTPIAYCF